MPTINLPFLDFESLIDQLEDVETLEHKECAICGYCYDGKCMIGSWLDPFTPVPRDINLCLEEHY